jgi:AAA15 family ATPase/GTPase
MEYLEEHKVLVEFSVKNFRSIKDKVTLSLVASSEEIHPENTFLDPSGKIRLLKTVAIYGANASGKSNIIGALGAMRSLLLRSHKLQRGDKLDVVPFRLDRETSEQPTEFEVVFIEDGLRYVYGFSADQDRIYEEWLSEADLGGSRVAPRVLFQRERQPDGTYKYSLGDYWKPKSTRLAQNTIENVLFLAKAVQDNHEKASKVFDWFRHKFRGMSGEPESTSEKLFTAELCERDESVKDRVLSMLRDADLGISNFVNKSETLAESSEWKMIPATIKEQILKDIGKEPEQTLVKRVVTLHQMAGSKNGIEFDLKDDESAGTQRFFSLAGPFIHSMMNGNIIFCDELDSSLHPMLTRALVAMVHQHSETPFQFVFTTHDCALLDAEVFRRDQIWFTEKNDSNATELYSLWDIKPRAGENFRKGYLNGRYGAIPFLGEFSFE